VQAELLTVPLEDANGGGTRLVDVADSVADLLGNIALVQLCKGGKGRAIQDREWGGMSARGQKHYGSDPRPIRYSPTTSTTRQGSQIGFRSEYTLDDLCRRPPPCVGALTAGVGHQLECIRDVLNDVLTGVVSNGMDAAQDAIRGCRQTGSSRDGTQPQHHWSHIWFNLGQEL
jgi:hypothetical protein